LRFENCTDAEAKGGKYRAATSGFGILHASCTGVRIDDATIGNTGSAQGVFAEGTPSTKVLVRRNKVDNDTAFTRNTGDIHEFNEYATKRQNARGKTAGNIADGGTIAHGCVNTPYRVAVFSVGSNATDIVKISAVDATNITVTIKQPGGTAGSAAPIMWEADS